MPAEQPARRDGRDGSLSASERACRGDASDAAVSELGERSEEGKSLEPADLYEQAPCPYLVLELDGTFVRANAAFFTLVAQAREVVGARRFQQLLTSAGAIFYETQILPTLHLYGARKEVALDIVGNAGQRVPVLANFSLRHDKEDRACGILVILMEATERRLYEKDLLRLRRDAEQISEVVLHSSDAIVAVSLSNTIESWNYGAEQMFGYSAGEAMGKVFAEFLFPRELRAEMEGARASLERGTVFTKDALALHKEHRLVNVSITLTPHMEAPGTLVAYSAIIRDDSARILAERALVKSEKLAAVGRLASSIAHEINNPLASVTNLIYLARLRAVDAQQQEYLSSADEELRRASAVASQTLRFHRQLSKPQAVSCEDIFSTLLSVYQGRLRNSSIAIERKNSAIRPVLCFEGDVRQALSNLLTNAMDAMPRGGRLLLRSREGTCWKSGLRGVILTLADTGTGMSPKTQAHLFEAFFTTKGIGGSGLGLWITAEILKRHGGRIILRSRETEPHRGTVASVFLPFVATLSSDIRGEAA